MPDPKKVIKDLTNIYDEAYDRWVHRPYIEDKLVTLIRDGIPDALTILREHEAVGLKTGIWLHPTSLDCCCSVCEGQPEHEPGEAVPLYPYCPYCGAKMEVKWDA